MQEDRRLIEDYLPIEAISAEASREKNVRKGHISTLHLWWARRPLVACRAAVYGARNSRVAIRPQQWQCSEEEVSRSGQCGQVCRAALHISGRSESDRRGAAAYPGSARRAADQGDGQAGDGRGH